MKKCAARFCAGFSVSLSVLAQSLGLLENIEDGVVWISRGDTFILERLVRTGILTTAFKLGWFTFRRCINLSTRLQTVHERLAMGAHWYLLGLGVKPSKHGGRYRFRPASTAAVASGFGRTSVLSRDLPAKRRYF